MQSCKRHVTLVHTVQPVPMVRGPVCMLMAQPGCTKAGKLVEATGCEVFVGSGHGAGQAEGAVDFVGSRTCQDYDYYPQPAILPSKLIRVLPAKYLAKV